MRAIVLLCLLTAGCSTVTPRLGSAIPRPGLPGRGAAIDSIPNPPRPDLRSDDRATRRRQCRDRAVPSGWIITSYEIVPECAGYTAGERNAAIIELLTPYRAGDTITVCADQRLPDNWDYDASAVDACPGAHVAAGEPTGIRIRRVR